MLTSSLVARLRGAVACAEETWLAPGEACDLGLVTGDRDVLARARAALADACVDVNLIARVGDANASSSPTWSRR